MSNFFDAVAIIIVALTVVVIIYGIIKAMQDSTELKNFMIGMVAFAIIIWAGVRVILLFD